MGIITNRYKCCDWCGTPLSNWGKEKDRTRCLSCEALESDPDAIQKLVKEVQYRQKRMIYFMKEALIYQGRIAMLKHENNQLRKKLL